MSQQNNLNQEIQEIQEIQAKNRGKYMPPEEISMFCEQVALILSSGVALYDGIEALCDNYKGTPHHASFEKINEGVRRTGSLHEALKDTSVFPPYVIEMARIGEQTGKLDHVMGALSLYYLREGKIRRSIQNAIIYPLSLLAMMAVVILVLVVKVLPIFDQVYKSLGAEMTGSAVAIMNFGKSVGNGVLILAGLLIVLVLVAVVLLKTGARQKVINAVGRVIPPIRRIYDCMAAERFASNMGMMLGSGFPLEESLPLIAAIFEDPIAKAKVLECNDIMNQSVSFPEAVAQVGIFDKLHNKMVQMGFLSGKTDSVMNKLAYMYEEELDNGISRVVAMIEPSMVALLSLIIGAILLSVMLPMVSIMSSIL